MCIHFISIKLLTKKGRGKSCSQTHPDMKCKTQAKHLQLPQTRHFRTNSLCSMIIDVLRVFNHFIFT